jgi:hypothetical protein
MVICGCYVTSPQSRFFFLGIDVLFVVEDKVVKVEHART